MASDPIYIYRDTYGYNFACTEHMLYPKEIAKLYRIRKHGRLDVKAVEETLEKYQKKNGIDSKFYYKTRRGTLRRVYPKSIYDPAVKELKEEKKNGV